MNGVNAGSPVTEKEEIAMKTRNTVLGPASVDATSPGGVVQTALTALSQGNFVEVVDQFNDQFTFSDHALDLEFKDKGRLREFLAKIREHFPDSKRKDNTIFSNERCVICEWTLTATHMQTLLVGSSPKVPIRVGGVSVVQIEHGKISQWSDYYDQAQSRRYSVAAWFTEWIGV
jgi:steroid delta-isomerase-like uncharacterized protein